MSFDADPKHKGDTIIIVRRKHEEEHGHHGGAWKIAYADFVTAMMAFFLVMWLINAANEKTKAQVASYFNPIKLTDTTTSKKGLNEPTTTSASLKEQNKAKIGEGEGIVPKQATEDKEKPQNGHFTEEQMFKNPYGVLAQLAGQAVQGAPAGHSAKGLAIVEVAEPGQKGGEAYRDPFDPLAWRTLADAKSESSLAQEKAKASAAEKPKEDIVAKPAETPPQPAPANTAKDAGHGPAKKNADTEAAEWEKQKAKETKDADLIAKTSVAVRQELNAQLGQFRPEQLPTIEVKQTKEGVLISLTDSQNFDMFAVGSAEPQPQLVLLMEKIAETLKGHKGKIIIRGHSDARRYRNKGYDNWRLSTARAQMAYYMLIRAGIAEQSVDRIEGYADHDLKNPGDPEAAENRRIELLLKVDEP